MTNMKWTLAHSPVALDALLQWYPLHDEVAPVLGERRTWLFCHAISTAGDCLICSTFFRRLLIDAGRHRGAHGRVVAHVGDRRLAAAAERLDLRAQRLELAGRAHVVELDLQRLADVERDDVVAVLRQRERHRAALAVRRTRDQRDAHAA